MDPQQILTLTVGVVATFAGLVWLASYLTRPRDTKEFTAAPTKLGNGDVRIVLG